MNTTPRATAVALGIRLEVVTVVWMTVEAGVAIVAGLMARSVLLAAFGVHIRRRDRAGRDPIVTPSVFGKRGYTGGLLVLTAFFSGDHVREAVSPPSVMRYLSPLISSRRSL